MRTLYYNGTILTMNREEPEAVLTEGDRIVALGSFEELQKEFSVDSSDLYDLQGKTLMPSFIDAHSHIMMAAQVSLYADLTECFSFEDIRETLMQYRKDFPERCGKMIVGFGYDHNVLQEECHPNSRILDQVSQEVPVFILHASAHMGVGNSRMLELAGVTAATKDPEGGRFGRYDGSDEPDGYAEEAAMLRIQEQFGAQMKTDFEEVMKNVQKMYLRYGVTTVQEGAASPQTIAALRQLASKGALVLDVVAYPVMMQGQPMEGTGGTASDTAYQGHFRIGGYKMILDGSPQGKSAWLSAPYEGESSYCGYPWLDEEVVLACCRKALEDGQQLLTHCNGDAASEQFLRCYERAVEEYCIQGKDLPEDLRPVMIHCQTVRQDQLERMKKLDMIASFFVGHVFYWGDVHLRNLGPARGNQISPVGSAKKQGLHFTFHQDTPVTKPDMIQSVWCAVNRYTRQGKKLAEAECVSVYDALRAITVEAAYQYHEEQEKGSIAPGRKADLVVLNRNPFAVDPEDLRDVRVETTIKDGRVVYQE